MSLSSSAIATGISNLTVTGVTIKDITAIPESVQARECPIMFPDPDNWISGGNAEPSDGSTTFGTPTTRTWIFNRSFNYVFLYAPVGSGRFLANNYSSLCTKIDSIITSILSLDLANIDVMEVIVANLGKLYDPAGSGFYGCTISIRLREWINP